jgi:hypothetical protein
MFGGWPWELDLLPVSRYQKLVDYYFETKKPPSDSEGDDPVSEGALE